MTNQTQTPTQPKTETKAPANPFAAFATVIPAFDPAQMTQMAQMFAPQHFAQLWTETAARAQAAAEQYAAQYGAFEKEMIVRAQGAVQTWAQLATDAIGYAGQLAVEARKLGLEAATKAAAVTKPVGN